MFEFVKNNALNLATTSCFIILAIVDYNSGSTFFMFVDILLLIFSIILLILSNRKLEKKSDMDNEDNAFEFVVKALLNLAEKNGYDIIVNGDGEDKDEEINTLVIDKAIKVLYASSIVGDDLSFMREAFEEGEDELAVNDTTEPIIIIDSRNPESIKTIEKDVEA